MIPWTRGSYHNIPMINGVEQPVGHRYRADSFEATENEISISYPDAYPEEASICGLVRSLELRENSLLISDRFDFSDKERQSVREVLMSVLPVEVENNAAIIGDRYRITANTGIISCERVPFEDACLEGDWKRDACYRIMIECDREKEICIKVEKL